MNQTTLKPTNRIVGPADFEFESVGCYLCGSGNWDMLLSAEQDMSGGEGRFRYVTCRDCGLAYLNPRIGLGQIKHFYDKDYLAYKSKKRLGIFTPLYNWAMGKHDRDKLKIASRAVSPWKGMKVLDVGCAVGSFLLEMKDKFGCAISGVDFNDELDFPRFGEIDFHCGLFYEQERLEKGSFDLITMWHFLEHCYDPMRSLAKAREVLAAKGKLIIEVPRLDSLTYRLYKDKWPGIQAPVHTVMFDKLRLIAMLEKSGFKVVRHMGYGAFPAYFYLFAGAYVRLFGKGVEIRKLIGPYFLGQALLMPVLLLQKRLNLGLQTIVCEKA